MSQTLSVILRLLLGGVLVGLVAMVYELTMQQGRLLLRQDELDERLKLLLPEYVQNPASTEHLGLSVGTVIPPFSLPDVTGKLVTLEDLRGRRVILVHWSPRCGFCDLIAPELAHLQADLLKQNVQLVLVSHEGVDLNLKLAAEHGLQVPILLSGDGGFPAFDYLGTPVAYLIDEASRVTNPLAIGAEQVPALLRKVVGTAVTGSRPKRGFGDRSLAKSRIEREGLKAGTVAPGFTLPDVRGPIVSLSDFRGQRVLLVFSDPHCGPCNELAPHLVRVRGEPHNDKLAVVLVSRGDLEENRRKVIEHGFDFPVVLQDTWKLSKEYGIFATPVAFLIDEMGVITRNVAKGTDQILALADFAGARHARPLS